MADPWKDWDEHIKETGRQSRLAEKLTDIEILNLLATEDVGPRLVEKRALKDELLARLEISKRRASAEPASPTPSPSGRADGRDAGVVPSHGEPMKGSYGPDATSTLPSKDENSRWR